MVPSELEALLTLGPSEWNRYLFLRDPMGQFVSEEDKQSIGAGARSCGAGWAANIAESFGPHAEEEICRAWGIKLVCDDSCPDRFALFEPPDTVTLSQGVFDKLKDYIKCCGLDGLLDADAIRRAALDHELFHCIESRSEDIYTRRKLYSGKALHFFRRRSRLLAPSEIGAAEFSRIYSGIAYDPCIYDIVFVYMTDEARGKRLYDKLMRYMA